MNEEIRLIEPKALWGHFADLNAVPRPSKKEERVIQFIIDFATSLNLKYTKDEVGNVIIKKPASIGMENKQTVCLQSHLDMVHQKNGNTIFDFDTQGIEMYIEDNWVKAKGTTLGADNGIGVASILTILASTTISHPAIEALFTIDEETGMTGALGLQGGLLEATILLNLDTEEDNELTIGCAGGIDVTGEGVYTTSSPTVDSKTYQITINGLTGGHSGIDIHRGRANANKLMNRLLMQCDQKFDIQIASIDGGSLRNAIPRESHAVIVVPEKNSNALAQFIKEYELILKDEYAHTDPNLNITITVVDDATNVLETLFQYTLLRTIYALPNGIYRMDSNIEGLVQSSNNVSRIWVKDGKYSLQNLTRSSSNSEKMDVVQCIQSSMELLGANVILGSSYPGWKPNPDSNIVKLMVDIYKKLHGGEMPLVNACHAGLECGILGTNYPTMEMISFGPTIRGAHSPDEKASISSVQKYWTYLLETLKQIPNRN